VTITLGADRSVAQLKPHQAMPTPRAEPTPVPPPREEQVVGKAPGDSCRPGRIDDVPGSPCARLPCWPQVPRDLYLGEHVAIQVLGHCRNRAQPWYCSSVAGLIDVRAWGKPRSDCQGAYDPRRLRVRVYDALEAELENSGWFGASAFGCSGGGPGRVFASASLFLTCAMSPWFDNVGMIVGITRLELHQLPLPQGELLVPESGTVARSMKLFQAANVLPRRLSV